MLVHICFTHLVCYSRLMSSNPNNLTYFEPGISLSYNIWFTWIVLLFYLQPLFRLLRRCWFLNRLALWPYRDWLFALCWSFLFGTRTFWILGVCQETWLTFAFYFVFRLIIEESKSSTCVFIPFVYVLAVVWHRGYLRVLKSLNSVWFSHKM